MYDWYEHFIGGVSDIQLWSLLSKDKYTFILLNYKIKTKTSSQIKKH